MNKKKKMEKIIVEMRIRNKTVRIIIKLKSKQKIRNLNSKYSKYRLNNNSPTKVRGVAKNSQQRFKNHL